VISVLYDLAIAPFVDFAFMRRALAGSIALSAGVAPVGVFLMLRRMSLMGDAISHAILPGAAIGYLLFGLALLPMAFGGLIAGLAVALLAGLATRFTALKEDASLAAFYLLSLAAGVLLISMNGSNIDLMHVLFGTVLALDNAALLFIATAASVSLIVLALIFRPLALECADPQFLRSVSGVGGLVHLVFLALVVTNLVAGFQALGTLLAVGIMMLPATAARFWARGLGGLMLAAFLIAVVSSYAGLLLSFFAGLPSGPAIIVVAGGIYILSLLAGPVGGALTSRLSNKHRTA
jgi:zinc/manganese transport system permease protein